MVTNRGLKGLLAVLCVSCSSILLSVGPIGCSKDGALKADGGVKNGDVAAAEASKPVTMQELKEAMPTASSDFLVACATEKLTLAQAKDRFIAQQSAEIAALRAEVRGSHPAGGDDRPRLPAELPSLGGISTSRPIADATRHHADVSLTMSKITWGGPIGSALELHRTHAGIYPDSLEDLLKVPQDQVRAKKWRGPYVLDRSSLRDSWNHDLMYRCPGQHHKDRYDLWSVGADGQDGTADDICNWTRN